MDKSWINDGHIMDISSINHRNIKDVSSMRRMVRAFNARITISFYIYIFFFVIFGLTRKSILNPGPIGASEKLIGPLNRA